MLRDLPVLSLVPEQLNWKGSSAVYFHHLTNWDSLTWRSPNLTTTTEVTQTNHRTNDHTPAPIITNAPETIPMACTGSLSTSKNHAVK